MLIIGFTQKRENSMSRSINGAGLAGVMVVCVCFITPMAVVGVSPIHKETSIIQDPVVFQHTPENGLYWNDRKVAEYPVPLYLHYYFSHYLGGIQIYIKGDNISRVQYYINGAEDFLDTEAPFGFILGPYPLPAFGHGFILTSKVYLDDGQIIRDDWTVYRLFP